MRSQNITTWKVSLLLFGSGMCALVYQMAWLREFRLIFGASTGASAAVLAIFMGGLGLGSLMLGHRADAQAKPLGFYAKLELIIAVTAAFTPLLLWAVNKVYIATGGSPVIGLWGATVVRLLLAALVLVVPTFLMGGTLPAAARSVEHDQDLGRRNLAFLYGANTMGAVTGSALATFFLVELFGTHKTLWAACLVNVLIALIARRLSEASVEEGSATGEADPVTESTPKTPVKTGPLKATAKLAPADVDSPDAAPVPPLFVLISAGIVGFAFLLMELVWYRMLSPILGGSTYTFGLILVVALFGIGLGGAAYAVLRANRAATLIGFALTCALEAAFIALPFALGDRLALHAMLLRSLSSLGFWGLATGWGLITMVVVLPAAFISGIQFPLLISLLGRGKAGVGRHIGLAYTYNTLGAIVGSLAGGFGLLPLLTAINAWRLVVIVLAALAAASLVLVAFAERAATARDPARPRTGEAGDADAPAAFPADLLARLAGPTAAIVVALLLIMATGPTGAWRHGGIGAGRSDRFGASPNALRSFLHDQRRGVAREWDGVESSVALVDLGGYTFFVNGKSDGHIRLDAGTQVISGLLGTLIHPNVKTSMVIGLGTGCTAGWLGVVPGMERVDVVELEPAILEIARACAAGNQDVMSNPKVKTSIGDAREALLTTPAQYDLIFSEPSNPYRAGIASLYTQDFYRACAKRLNPGGLFMQWLQTYEVDGQTVRTVYATLGSVFPSVETWRTQTGDTVLMASLEPIRFDVPAMRRRLAEEPFRTAMGKIWRIDDVEGVFGRHLANSEFARSVVKAEGGRVNTDDQNFVEFSFARSVGRVSNFGAATIHSLAEARGESRPVVVGDVDWDAVEDRRASSYFAEGAVPPMKAQRPGEPQALRNRRFRVAAMAHMLRDNSATAVEQWQRQPRPPADLTERLFMARAYADAGQWPDAATQIEAIRIHQPVEADGMTAYLLFRQKRYVEAVDALEITFRGYQRDPWPHVDLMHRMQQLAINLTRADITGNAGKRLYGVMSEPFVLQLYDDERMKTLVQIATYVDDKTGSKTTADAISKFEPHVPWDVAFLETRFNAYRIANHPLTILAAKQLDEFRANEPFPFDLDLAPAPPPPTLPTTGPATGPTSGPSTGPSTQPAPELPTDPIPMPGGPAPNLGGGSAPPPPPAQPPAPPGDGRGERR